MTIRRGLHERLVSLSRAMKWLEARNAERPMAEYERGGDPERRPARTAQDRALGTALSIEIPEEAYPEMLTLDGSVAYLARRLGNADAG